MYRVLAWSVTCMKLVWQSYEHRWISLRTGSGGEHTQIQRKESPWRKGFQVRSLSLEDILFTSYIHAGIKTPAVRQKKFKSPKEHKTLVHSWNVQISDSSNQTWRQKRENIRNIPVELPTVEAKYLLNLTSCSRKLHSLVQATLALVYYSLEIRDAGDKYTISPIWIS